MSGTQHPELLAELPADSMEQPEPSTERPESCPVEPESGPTPTEATRTETSVEHQERLTEKSQWSNWTVLAMLVLCFYLIVQFRPFGSSGPQEHAGVGKRLPDLKLRPLTGTGEPVALADLTGKVVLINFWGAWNGPSREELSCMAEIQEKFRGNPALKVLAISCKQGRMASISQLRRDTEAVLEARQIRMPVYADSGGVSRSAVESVVGFDDFPTTLILDRHGRVRSVWTGFRPEMEVEMQQLIRQLLSEG